ncbi:hypothetical protein BCR34DRAFT_595581 [Clohesyomyces aquaticus]|uniref:Uncharacterized protein n=1 Tax=Clohesyomyces aquaticus TaxID=1231657 RepID=A0A1Y2A9E3_9PLEO|nr:hypothetical protein BCR34DRAFT_595581 [Clohesyomyces aquaticus]
MADPEASTPTKTLDHSAPQTPASEALETPVADAPQEEPSSLTPPTQSSSVHASLPQSPTQEEPQNSIPTPTSNPSETSIPTLNEVSPQVESRPEPPAGSLPQFYTERAENLKTKLGDLFQQLSQTDHHDVHGSYAGVYSFSIGIRFFRWPFQGEKRGRSGTFRHFGGRAISVSGDKEEEGLDLKDDIDQLRGLIAGVREELDELECALRLERKVRNCPFGWVRDAWRWMKDRNAGLRSGQKGEK